MVSGVGDKNMSIKLREYIGKISAMHREDIGDVLPMSSRCIGSASRVHREYIGDASRRHRRCIADVFTMHRECIADVSGTKALGFRQGNPTWYMVPSKLTMKLIFLTGNPNPKSVLNAGGKPEYPEKNLRKRTWTEKPSAHKAASPGLEPATSLVQGEGSTAAPTRYLSKVNLFVNCFAKTSPRHPRCIGNASAMHSWCLKQVNDPFASSRLIPISKVNLFVNCFANTSPRHVPMHPP